MYASATLRQKPLPNFLLPESREKSDSRRTRVLKTDTRPRFTVGLLIAGCVELQCISLRFKTDRQTHKFFLSKAAFG